MDPDELYGLPLERFVPERTALAKVLRQQGRREEAARVAKLPKPSVAAWAVNQLVRTQGRAVRDLFGAGEALQQAQSDLLAGRGDAAAMRDAAERERAVVDELTSVARGLLSSEGKELTQNILDRVAETLHAAAFDEDARAKVRDGSLEKELRHVGLGGLGAGTGTPVTARQRTARRQPTRQRAEERTRARAARKAEADARRASELAARELEAAQARRDRAADQLADAESALQAASERAEQAETAHRQAREALERL